MKQCWFIILLGCLVSTLSAQELAFPLDFEPVLAGNFGELRPNHFHAGLDFKTQQTIGHDVRSSADGWVERVAINAYGYGLVIYVTHPELKRMTVYAHLDTFSEKIWEKVRERQVKEELNNADLTFEPDEIPVAQGEVIAKSGNTGSSGGPHLHYEVRGLMSAPGADDEYWYDPIQYFMPRIKDTTPPRISNIYIYTDPGTDYVRHRQILNRKTTSWGRVGFALKAYDYMDGQANKYGVKRLKLYCDDRLIFNWNQLYFQYYEQSFTNSVIDYAEWRNNRSMIMKAFVEPGNELRMIDHTLGDGVIEIDEERPYHLRYELEDAHGNKSTLAFTVDGSKKAERAYPPIVKPEKEEQPAVAPVDSIAPVVSIIGKTTANTMTITVHDSGSGVKGWKVYIDGQFVPFDMNNKGRIVGHPSLYGIKNRGTHKVVILATDKVGNEKRIERSIVF